VCICLDKDWWEQVAKFRRKSQRISKSRLVFIDQTGIHLAARPHYSLAPRGKPAYVVSDKPIRYSKRFDIMGAISGNGVLALDVFSPAQRTKLKVRGYTKGIILKWIRKSLAKQIREMGVEEVVVVLDKGNAIKSEEVMEALVNGKCNNVAEVRIMSTGIAKEVSPLDNNLWHQLKQHIRSASPKSAANMIKIIKSSWDNITRQQVSHYYHHCALYPKRDPYSRTN
jgi:hypothetical protein